MKNLESKILSKIKWALPVKLVLPYVAGISLVAAMSMNCGEEPETACCKQAECGNYYMVCEDRKSTDYGTTGVECILNQNGGVLECCECVTPPPQETEYTDHSK